MLKRISNRERRIRALEAHIQAQDEVMAEQRQYLMIRDEYLRRALTEHVIMTKEEMDTLNAQLIYGIAWRSHNDSQD
jgi:hypothetical protein